MRKLIKISVANNLDFYAIDAAHIVAMVVDKPEDKVSWNKKALEIALVSKDERASSWRGTLYNNIGMNYLKRSCLRKHMRLYK